MILLPPLLLLLLPPAALSIVVWHANNYPNPTTVEGYRECTGNRTAETGGPASNETTATTTQLCDPDGVLNDYDRGEILRELSELQQSTRTARENSSDPCGLGTKAFVLIGRRVRGGDTPATKEMVRALQRKWNLDWRCQQTMLILLIADDRQFWATKDEKVTLECRDIEALFGEQKPLLASKEFGLALRHYVKSLRNRILEGPAERKGGNNNHNNNNSDNNYIGWGVFVVVIVAGIILFFVCIKSGCKCGGGGGYSRSYDGYGHNTNHYYNNNTHYVTSSSTTSNNNTSSSGGGGGGGGGSSSTCEGGGGGF